MLLILAWCFMAAAVYTTALLIDDLRKEENCNKMYRKRTGGEYHGL